jgi:hypothetical protein
MIEDDAPEKLKHFSAHVAMLPQSSICAHGFALCGHRRVALRFPIRGVELRASKSAGSLGLAES